jgi:hypothetical protein
MATNLIFNSPVISVICTDPTTPTSGAPVRHAGLTGVAITDESGGGNASGYTTVDFTPGKVWDLSCKGVDGDGNAAIAAGDPIYYVDADTPKLSKKAAGYFFGYALEAVTSGSTDTIRVLKAASGNGRKGHMNLDITTCRVISGNAIQNTTEAGVPDGNTSPSLARVNGATDKALRLAWAGGSSEEIQFAPWAKPADMDEAGVITVNLLLAKGSNTDTSATVAISVWDGVGDTNAGGNTAALAVATVAKYSVTLAAADLAAGPGALNIGVTPGTHASDAIYCYGAWLEYTRA